MSFTVLIPCHNDGAYLERSVGSAAAQLTNEDEVIVVDDGSDEPVEALVRELAQRWPEPKITCLPQAQSGVAAARNYGIQAAKGEFLIMLDADDELLPGAIEAYREQMVTSDWIISAHEWQVGEERTVRVPDVAASQETLFRRYLDKRLHLGNLSCMCIRRQHAASIGFANHLRVGEDLVFLAVLISNYPPSGLSKPCARVHRRASGSLRSVSTIEDAQQSEVFSTLFDHPRLPDSYRPLRKLAEVRHCRSVMRMAWREQRADVYKTWHNKLIAQAPLSGLNPKLLARRLWLKLRG